MALVEILEVTKFPVDFEQLWEGFIDIPQPGSWSETHAINVVGWALGRYCAAIAVEFVHKGDVHWRSSINVQRPDIAAHFPDISAANQSGFETMVSVLQLPTEFELLVRVVLRDESQVPLGVIRARRRSLTSDFQPKLHPLMVNTVGRSGSTWLMSLLGQHPKVVAYRPFEYDPRVSSYWMEILKTLSEPACYYQSITPDKPYGSNWWLGDRRSSPLQAVDPQLHQWLGKNHVEELASFCQNRIEAFYEEVAVVQGQTNPVYFAEKYTPNPFVSAMIWQLYYQTREIFLIRDFRDVFCSLSAFTKKYAYAKFFGDQASSEQEYIHELRRDATSILQNWKKRSDKAYLLHYEDLIQRPNEMIKSVLDYLDLDSDPTTVQHMLQDATRTIPEAQRQHQTSLDSLRSVGRWRHDLTPELKAVCQEAFGDVLEEFGYGTE